MTQAERLVSSMAKEKLATAARELRPQLDAIHTDRLPLQTLPVSVREAVRVVRRYGPKVNAAEQVIHEAGFRLEASGVQYDYKTIQCRQRGVNDAYQARRIAIDKLRATALIQLIGLAPGAAHSRKQILQTFQQELEQL